MLMKLSIKNSEKYVFKFDYIKIDVKCFFFPTYVRLFFFDRLLEIKKNYGGIKV